MWEPMSQVYIGLIVGCCWPAVSILTRRRLVYVRLPDTRHATARSLHEANKVNA
jgi:hypothetical protein